MTPVGLEPTTLRTGALEFTRNEDCFQVTFSSSACVDCGLCLKFCEPHALQRQGAPTVGELISTEPVILHTGTLTRCRKCNTLFAGKSDNGLCPICAFRRQNPFGGRWNAPMAPKSIPEDKSHPES